MIVLSHFQASPLLKAKKSGLASAVTSTDLGLTPAAVTLEPEVVGFPDGERLAWTALAEIAANEAGCYAVAGGQAALIRGYSELTGRYYSLYPTESAPTMVVAGFPMHRIKGTNPRQDTLAKIKALAPLGGRVLDTTTGLGYTAIEAARTAVHVTTIELDPVAQEICRQNPWSQALFDNPKITQIIGDSFDEIEHFEAESFSAIVHDPPTLSLAGDLYSGEFYRRAFGVLKRNGKLFHYIGDPDSASGGRTTKGVAQRLLAAGFARVQPARAAFGVVAYKKPPEKRR